MPWSLPDPRPAEPVLGDPASLGALGSAIRRAAADLEDSLAHLSAGAVSSRRHARRIKALHRDAAIVLGALQRTGPRLTQHSGELADAIGLARRLADRAQSLDLQVDGPVIAANHGVRGVADPQAEQSRTEALSRLQRVLDAILIDLDTARRRLREDLDSERTRVHRGCRPDSLPL